VHREGKPAYLSQGASSIRGTPATGPAGEPAPAGRCGLPLRRLPGLPAGLLRFSDVNVVSTALIYEIIVAERLDVARVVVRRRSRRWVEGLYWCPPTGAATGDATGERAGGGSVGYSCPVCGGRWRCGPRPSGSRTRRTRTACQSSVRRWWPSTWAPVWHPHRCPALQHRPGAAAVCLQRLLRRVPHLLPELPAGHGANPLRGRRGYPRLRQHRRRGGRQRPRPAGRAGRRAGLQRRRWPGRHDQGIFGHRHAQVRVGRARSGDRRVPLRRHAPHPLGHQRPRALGWQPRRTPADSVAAYAAWLKGMDGLDGVLAEANARMRSLGVVRKAGR